jgi:hypothetical protein
VSNKRLTAELILSTIDKASAPLKKIQGGAGKTAKALKDNYRHLNELKHAQGNISSFRRIQAATEQNADKMTAAREATKSLKKQIEGTDKPSKALIARFQRASKTAERLEQKHRDNRSKLSALNKEFKAAGWNIRNLSSYEEELTKKTEAANEKLEQQKKRLSELGKRQKLRANVAAAGGTVRDKAGSLFTQGAVAGAAGGYLFKTQFLDKAAQFEDLRAVLKTVEGSSAKAHEAMNWVSDFAASTPYELADVTDAYKQLRAYGLDPTKGLLKDLGDTAAAMDKPVMQAVEAMADAITGENERLKEFGIRASKDGGKIIYEYTNKAGEQMTTSVMANNRKQIEDTLRTIWNEKYGGAMDERSRTWNGMMSNLSDQWTRFAILVMDAGLFDWMKDKLGGLLETVNTMAADGSLQALAKEWGDKLTAFASGTWEVINAIHTVTSTIAGMVGGWENLVYILAFIKFSPLIGSTWKLTKAMKGLMFGEGGLVKMPWVLEKFKLAAGATQKGAISLYGHLKTLIKTLWSLSTKAFAAALAGAKSLAIGLKALGSTLLTLATKGLTVVLAGLRTLAVFLVTNPIGIAISVIAGLAYLIYKNWAPIKEFFSGMWQEVKAAFSNGIGGVAGLLINWSPVGLIYSAIRKGLSLLGIELPAKFTEFGGHLIDGIIGGITGKLKQLKDTVTGAASAASNWFKEKLGINSPSKVFASHGSDVMAGLHQGLANNKKVLGPVNDVSKRLKQAGAGIALGTAAMGAAAGQIAIDSRAPLSAGAAAGSGGGSQKIEIHVHAAPGMNEQTLAQLVAREVERIQAGQAAARRSNLSDED